MADGVFCGNCGEPMKDEPLHGGDPAQRLPCPRCGSMARSFHLTLESAVCTAVASPIEVVFTPFEERLLASAKKAIDDGYYGFAVIIAHTACELAAERAMSQAFAASGVGHLKKPVSKLIFSYNLSTKNVRDLYNALTVASVTALMHSII